MAINSKGRTGESLCRELLLHFKVPMFQVDWMYRSNKDGKWKLVEMKNKQPYRRIKEDGSLWFGMGLPIDQVTTRLEFQSDKDVRAQLIWTNVSYCDMAGHTKCVPVTFHYAWIDELEQTGDYVDIPKPRNGGKALRIYNVELFNEITINISMKKFKEILSGNC